MTTSEIIALQERQAKEAATSIKWLDGFQLKDLSRIEVLENKWNRRLENRDSTTAIANTFLEIEDTVYDKLLVEFEAKSEDGRLVYLSASSGEYEETRYYEFILLAEKETDEVDVRLVTEHDLADQADQQTDEEAEVANVADPAPTGSTAPTDQPKEAGERTHMPSVKGSIKVGRHTEGHGAWLKARGYTVTEEPGKIIVEGSAFVEALDLSGTAEQQVAALKAVIAAKQLLTYETKAQTPKGQRSSIMLCGYLGAASALVVKPQGKGAKTDSTSIFAAL